MRTLPADLEDCEHFGRAFASHGIDLHCTPQRHLEAMQTVDKVIVFGIKSLALQMDTPNDQIATYARALGLVPAMTQRIQGGTIPPRR